MRLTVISLYLGLYFCFLETFLPTPSFQLPYELFSPRYLSKDLLVGCGAISFSLSLLQTGGLRERTVMTSYITVLELFFATYKTTLFK